MVSTVNFASGSISVVNLQNIKSSFYHVDFQDTEIKSDAPKLLGRPDSDPESLRSHRSEYFAPPGLQNFC